MDVLRERHPEDPAADMALTERLLREVAAGSRAGTLRVFRPGPTVAFGRRDALLPGFGDAQAAARAHGFTPVVRLGGGRAAAYDDGAVIVEWIEPTPAFAAPETQARFATAASVLSDALQAVGIPAEIGELPGEYCPGRWSLHAAGSHVKLAGLAQRAVRGAALTTGVVVVERGGPIRRVLEAVYAALALPWDPTTAGAAEDVLPGLRASEVEDAVQRLAAES